MIISGNVNVSIDLDVARRMLLLAGFQVPTSDEEVFKMVLSMINKYGATCNLGLNTISYSNNINKNNTNSSSNENEDDWPTPCEKWCVDGYCTFDKSEEDIENGYKFVAKNP